MTTSYRPVPISKSTHKTTVSRVKVLSLARSWSVVVFGIRAVQVTVQVLGWMESESAPARCGTHACRNEENRDDDACHGGWNRQSSGRILSIDGRWRLLARADRPSNRILKRTDDVSVVDLEFIIASPRLNRSTWLGCAGDYQLATRTGPGCGDWRIISWVEYEFVLVFSFNCVGSSILWINQLIVKFNILFIWAITKNFKYDKTFRSKNSKNYQNLELV